MKIVNYILIGVISLGVSCGEVEAKEGFFQKIFKIDPNAPQSRKFTGFGSNRKRYTVVAQTPPKPRQRVVKKTVPAPKRERFQLFKPRTPTPKKPVVHTPSRASANGFTLLSLRRSSEGRITIKSNARIIREAKKWEGKHYRYKVSAQCANFINHVAKESGVKTRPRVPARARAWLNVGAKVSPRAKKPGDILIFWRNSRYGNEGHIGIYAGKDKHGKDLMIHRPTMYSRVKTVSISGKYYEKQLLGVRRVS